jgi:hypothetical protein
VNGLAAKIVALHRSLAAGGIPHAFGGALALAWCTQRARGTIDIDINIFVSVDRVTELLEALPAAISKSHAERELLVRDGQARLWWDDTPIDVFLNTTEFHEQVALRVRHEEFAGMPIPFLACSDVAVFKAFFNRTKDWADLEEMATAGTIDLDRVVGVISRYLGPDDPRVTRLLALTSRTSLASDFDIRRVEPRKETNESAEM